MGISSPLLAIRRTISNLIDKQLLETIPFEKEVRHGKVNLRQLSQLRSFFKNATPAAPIAEFNVPPPLRLVIFIKDYCPSWNLQQKDDVR
jgi:hypothetical protein